MVSTTNCELYIVELAEPFSEMEIQFVPPTIGTSRDARLQNVAIVGRNDDLVHYIGGSETLNLELEFYADEKIKELVYDKVNWLKSLTMNDSNRSKIRNVKLVFGDLFKYQVWIVKSVKPTFSNFSQKDNWLPLRAKVQLSLQLDTQKNRYIKDARNGK